MGIVSWESDMKSLLDIMDWTESEYNELFIMIDKLIAEDNYFPLNKKSVVLFFPDTSIRTRMTFELGIKKFGGEIISFTDSTLDKKEDIEDVVKYIQNWTDVAIVRHNEFNVLEAMDKHSNIPIINAMTSKNHPCEIIHDLYAIKKIRGDFTKLKFLYIGPKTNIGYSWYQSSQKFGFKLTQVCPIGYDIADKSEYFNITRDLDEVISDADIIITDTIIDTDEYIQKYQIDYNKIKSMKKDSIFNPTPPFYRGGVISDDLDLNNTTFAGYDFKKHLLEVQVGIICKCLL